MVMFKFDNKEIYMEKAFQDLLDKKLKEVKMDGDLLITVTAGEGYGKSLFARQLGAYISKRMGTTFNLDNIHFTTNDFVKSANDSPKYTVHILDEARANLYRGSSNSKQNKFFTTWLSMARSKNLIMVICLPSAHDLDNYVMKWRCGMWINIQKVLNKKTGIHERGFYSVMAIRKREKFLKYLDNKYASIPRTLNLLKGRFSKIDPLDNDKYEEKKQKKIKEIFIDPNEDVLNGKEEYSLTDAEKEAILGIKPSDAYPKDMKFRSRLKNLQFKLRKTINSLGIS